MGGGGIMCSSGYDRMKEAHLSVSYRIETVSLTRLAIPSPHFFSLELYGTQSRYMIWQIFT